MLAQLIKNPRKILLIDAIGAFITASILFIVAKKYQVYFGLPQLTLTFLSYTALVIFSYSLGSFLFIKKISKTIMQLLMTINLLYCGLTFGLVIYLYSEITFFGITYFVAEIVIILLLVTIERIVTKTIHQNSKKK